MDSVKPSFQTKSLQRAESDDDYTLYRAALEFGLIAPIVIETAKDLKSERVWKALVTPYKHQVTNLMNFCRRLPVTLLADDVGLGKTISAGLVASELIVRGRVKKILIVCPKLLIPQWKEELETKFGIKGIGETGSKILKVKLPEEGGALITTYHSAKEHLDELGKLGFDMLILDEAHKLRNLYGTEKAPQVATRFRKALSDRMFRYVLMLTATPIQNRLWDLYSLVDLLTVARGHENPFGNASSFARKFIEGDQTQARRLRLEKQEEFRGIVYSYMSRFRRADAELSFPERKVELYRVQPTEGEKELFSIVEKEIEGMNRLGQISVAKALVSSPQALAKQFENMALNETIAPEVAIRVRNIASQIGMTAKLGGLSALIEKLRTEKPDNWRVVIFTERRETQAVIDEYLSSQKIVCGLINGTSGQRNQETITLFKKDIPDLHVIISTEAGSEGVNLQAANVLVNYDLPWNPMIVEQRIGRVQRLGSQHSSVCIFNMVLQGTFEEYIVARLLEKLQMAAHAVGDVEALLEAAGMGDDAESLEDKILSLVVASLAGKDVEVATRLQAKNITEAKIQLEREEEVINTTLGANDAYESGPSCPKLPAIAYSLPVKDFVLEAFKSLGTDAIERPSGQVELLLEGGSELIGFDEEGNVSATVYSPGTPALHRLADKVSKTGKHRIEDVDIDPLGKAQKIAQTWVEGFGLYVGSELKDVKRSYSGTALMNVRTTVAHDSYERLVEVACLPERHIKSIGRPGLEPTSEAFSNPSAIGLAPDILTKEALADTGVAEFSRFYLERLAHELPAVGSSEYKRKKIEDDLTPRVEMALVGLKGSVQRQIDFDVTYKINDKEYSSSISIIPSSGDVVESPEMVLCVLSNVKVPKDCLASCEISGSLALQHLLRASDVSERLALPENTTTCSLTGKVALTDEIENSDITGKAAIKGLLVTSAISGKRAEPNLSTQCEFTSTNILLTESALSQISGKRYRLDEQARSVVSGKLGHQTEFVACAETAQLLLSAETETCEITGKIVKPGILECCDVTGKKVMPTELEKSAVSGKMALKKLFVSSSLSSVRLLEEEAIRSSAGKFCSPVEARPCAWSGTLSHPDDLKSCQLTSLQIRSEYLTRQEPHRLESLVNILEGTKRKSDLQEHWSDIATKASLVFGGGRCRVEASEVSLDSKSLAVGLELKTVLGLKTRYVGLLYSLSEKNIVGRLASGKRENNIWKYELHY